MKTDPIAKAERLFEIFHQQDADGSYLYTQDDMLHFVPVLLKSFGDPENLSNIAQMLMGKLAEKMGLSPDTPEAELQGKVDAYFAEHPVNPGLLSVFEQFLREEMAGGGGEEVGKAFAKFLTDQESFERLKPENKPDPAKSPMSFMMQSIKDKKSSDK